VAGLHTPLGLLWIDDQLYVAEKEQVVAYSGFDGSRFSSQRTVLTLPAGVGESNGLTATPDGRIQLGISSPCDHCTPASPYSAAIISFRPDGTDLRVDASRIRAPIGLTYTPWSHQLLVTMNQRDDLGAATPGDWLSIVHQGDNWGFPACWGQGGEACAGVPRPFAELDPHAAVSGVAVVDGSLGAVVGRAAIVAEWATAKVLWVPADGTRTSTPSLLVSGIQHPVPVVTGPDQAVYIGDWQTGTIYRVTKS
jgi:glucose/arabinose dehydrogenase